MSYVPGFTVPHPNPSGAGDQSGSGGGGGGEAQTPWGSAIDAAGYALNDVGKINLGTAVDNPNVMFLDLAGSNTFSGGEHVILHEYGSYAAAFDTANGGSFVGVHITPVVSGAVTVSEIVGIQSQISSIANVTSHIHAVEALVNFGAVGKTAVLSRSIWAQTVAAFGTITEAIGLDATGGSGLGTITTMYGARIGRTSGALMLQGTTIYGVYVNQGSVRNYFGGDLQIGGGTNGAWDSYVLNVDSGGASLVGLLDVTGSAAQIVVGAATAAAGYNPEASLEKVYTWTAGGSTTGLLVSGTKTFTTNSGSFYGIAVQPTLSLSIGMSEIRGVDTSLSVSAGSARTVTSFYGVYARAQIGVNTTATTAWGVYSDVQVSLGTITTGVGVEAATSAPAGTFTTAVGLRITNLSGGTTKWAMQVGDFQSYHHGLLTIGSTAAPTYALDLKGTAANRAAIGIIESVGTPTNPSANDQAIIYVRGNKIIFAWNDTGTMRYKYLDLTGTGVTWVHSLTAPT